MGGEHSKKSIEKTARRVFIEIYRLSGQPLEEITLDLPIDYRIAIDGDDVDDLLLAIDSENQIDWTGFNFYDYFMDEGQISSMITRGFFLLPITILVKIVQLFFPRLKRNKPSKTPKNLTVLDLVGTVYNQSWQRRAEIPELQQESLSLWAQQLVNRFNRRYNRKTRIQ